MEIFFKGGGGVEAIFKNQKCNEHYKFSVCLWYMKRMIFCLPKFNVYVSV